MTTTSIFFERQTRAISDVGAEEVCVGTRERFEGGHAQLPS